jgi:phage regulator Rha-like protein
LYKEYFLLLPTWEKNMSDDFRIDVPFEKRPPRLKDIINSYVMGDVWVRDTPFGPVTDSLKIAEKFEMEQKNVLRSIKKCEKELGIQLKFELNKNIIENSYLGGARGKERKNLKYDITEFGLALILLYINTPKARLISAEILYRFFVLKTYLSDLSENQIGAIRGHYRKNMK